MQSRQASGDPGARGDAPAPSGVAARLLSALGPRAVDWAERGLVPDPVLRLAVRALVRDRLSELSREGDRRAEFAQELARGPVAVHTQRANDQHYEVPPAFFREALGPRLKYSCALFEDGNTDLAAAEDAMLELSAARAGLEDGMRVLELGCGWGSLSLFIAERFPGCEVLAVSNSKVQGEWIHRECRRRGLGNVTVHTADMNGFDPGALVPVAGPFDRVMSIEMFEHIRNWGALLGRVAGWLTPEGRVFLHTFCHRDRAYAFEDRGEGDWMARHFFSGGIMPSADWIRRHAQDLEVVEQWFVDGRHYRDTSEAWLARVDARREAARRALADGGHPDPERALQRWRMFFLAVAELFGFQRGQEWFVQHALLAPVATGGRR
ncbi:MAG: SAM-dependent methyltransferase [Myxococcota bacterium]